MAFLRDMWGWPLVVFVASTLAMSLLGRLLDAPFWSVLLLTVPQGLVVGNMAAANGRRRRARL